jgi:hypothetical protein
MRLGQAGSRASHTPRRGTSPSPGSPDVQRIGSRCSAQPPSTSKRSRSLAPTHTARRPRLCREHRRSVPLCRSLNARRKVSGGTPRRRSRAIGGNPWTACRRGGTPRLYRRIRLRSAGPGSTAHHTRCLYLRRLSPPRQTPRNPGCLALRRAPREECSRQSRKRSRRSENLAADVARGLPSYRAGQDALPATRGGSRLHVIGVVDSGPS